MNANLDYDKIYEIRLRVGRPLFYTYDGGEGFLTDHDGKYVVTREDLKETMEYISGYSLYSYEDEMRQGFLTVQGGHRVGVTGKVILDGNEIQGMKYISCINVRLAHEVVGCADQVMPYIRKKDWVAHTLIVSPPRGGKTTLLRDIIRQLSNGEEKKKMPGVTVGVVDERSELAGSYQGVPQNDLGMRTDVLDGCPKAEGMMLLLRSMNPQVLAADEITAPEDVAAVSMAANCGVSVLATAHGGDLEELRRRPLYRSLLHQAVFQRVILIQCEEDGSRSYRMEGLSC